MCVILIYMWKILYKQNENKLKKEAKSDIG